VDKFVFALLLSTSVLRSQIQSPVGSVQTTE